MGKNTFEVKLSKLVLWIIYLEMLIGPEKKKKRMIIKKLGASQNNLEKELQELHSYFLTSKLTTELQSSEQALAIRTD